MPWSPTTAFGTKSTPSTQSYYAPPAPTPTGGYSQPQTAPDPYADFIGGWKNWWAEYQSSLDSWLKQQLKANRKDFEGNRDQANVTKMRQERQANYNLGPNSGRGIGTMAGINSNWMNAISNYRNTMQDANARARDNYAERRAAAYERYLNAVGSYL